MVRLSGDRPVRYRDAAGKDEEVDLDDDASRAFYLDQDFEVAEGETTAIVVSLDPYRSLVKGDRLVFKPRGDARPRGRGVAWKGFAPDANARWLCAYAYDLKFPPPRHDGDGGGKAPPPGVMPPPRVEDRPFVATKDDVVKDEAVACERAFAKAPVVGGEYELRHLLPGSYTLRFFLEDGTVVDGGDDVTLAPPAPPSGHGGKLRAVNDHELLGITGPR